MPPRDEMMRYCLGEWIPTGSREEADFLKGIGKVIGGGGARFSTGPIGEWAVQEIVSDTGLHYDSQVNVKTPDGRVMRPDGYIPELDMYVEVKSRAYHSSGASWSEKLDHIPRKYSRICGDGRSSCLVVFSANQMYERTGRALLDQTEPYVRDFVGLARKYGVCDWIPITQLRSYVIKAPRRRGMVTRSMARMITHVAPVLRAPCM